MTEQRLPTAHGARRALISNRRLWQAAWWIGIATAALALLFALERHWLLAVACGVAAAAVLWLSGAWVGPWSADAYVRRVLRAWDSWATRAQWAYDAFADHRRPRFVDRVQRLQPPKEWVDERARLLDARLGATGCGRGTWRCSKRVARERLSPGRREGRDLWRPEHHHPAQARQSQRAYVFSLHRKRGGATWLRLCVAGRALRTSLHWVAG